MLLFQRRFQPARTTTRRCIFNTHKANNNSRNGTVAAIDVFALAVAVSRAAS